MPTASTLQRQVSPIPPGRYWLHVIGDLQIREFGDWVRDMSGAVRVETVEEDEGGVFKAQRPRTLFVIFTVPEGRAPFLNAVQFGFPTHAPPEVRTESDVVRAPEPEDPKLPSFGELGGVGILFLFALLLLSGNNR